MCNSYRMSEQHAAVITPQWDRADRMRKALRVSGITVFDMADYLGVSRTSVSNWINGRVQPSVQTLRLWASATGVSYEWLCHGHNGPHPPGSNNMQCLQTGVLAA